MLATNASVIGCISTDEAYLWPRWPTKKADTPPPYCNRGWYTLRYIRSMDSISKTTWSDRTSATVRGSVMTGLRSDGGQQANQPLRAVHTSWPVRPTAV